MKSKKSISESKNYKTEKREESTGVKKNNLNRAFNLLFISDYEEGK